MNNRPDGWSDMGYSERESWRRGAMARDNADERAYQKLEEGDQVETPDGWVGFVAEKEPDGLRVYVESWERAGTYRASRLEKSGSVTGGL